MPVVLYQAAVDLDGNGKDAALVDGNGKKWTLPFDEPTEFLNDFMASKIVEHCHYYGVVEVHSTRDRSGVHYDMDDARQRAAKALDVSMDTCINDYIVTQLEDRVRKNYPPLPPTGRALECCIVKKYNLLKAGIRCVGWMPPYEMEDPGYGNTPAAMPSTLQEQINALNATFQSQQLLLLELLKGKLAETKTEVVAAKPRKGKPAVEVEPEPVEAEPVAETVPTDEYEADQSATKSVRL